jgi:hypothetical protein
MLLISVKPCRKFYVCLNLVAVLSQLYNILIGVHINFDTCYAFFLLSRFQCVDP